MLKLLLDGPSTDIEMTSHGLPPLPVDPEMSKVRLSHEPILLGDVITTFGVGGYAGRLIERGRWDIFLQWLWVGQTPLAFRHIALIDAYDAMER